MFTIVRNLIEQRRLKNDLLKTRALGKAFSDAVRAAARKHGCESSVNPIEVSILGNFVITEIYLASSRDADFASDVLDNFHKVSAEGLLNANLLSLQEKFPEDDVGAMYDEFMKFFYEKTEQRYVEYRAIMMDEDGLFQFSERHFSDLGSHLVRSSDGSNGEDLKRTTFDIGLAVLDHMSRCVEVWKH